MRLVIFHRAGTDRGGRGIDGTGHHRHVVGQSQGAGDALVERSDHVGAFDDLGELVPLDAATPQERVAIHHVLDVPVVRHPGGQDRVRGRHEPPCEPEVQVIEDVQELVGPFVDVGKLVLDEEHVGRGVFARGGRCAARQSDPPEQPEGVIPADLDGPSRDLSYVSGPARIHPEDGVHQMPPVGIHRDGTLPLRAATERHDVLTRHDVAADDLLARFEQCIPPVIRVLFGPAIGQDPGFHGVKSPSHDAAMNGNQGGLASGGPQIDSKNVLAVRHAQASSRGASRRITRPARGRLFARSPRPGPS